MKMYNESCEMNPPGEWIERKTNIKSGLFWRCIFSTLPENIIQYFECMGNTIKLNETGYGSAYTTLFSIDDVEAEQNFVCTENRLLIIGCGLNGDLITINLLNSRVGYVFHDDLWEENYDVFEEIYVELPFGIEQFLNMAIENKDYPIDGNMAENMENQWYE